MGKFGFAGWVLAAIMFGALIFQRSCQKMTRQILSKTVTVAGDKVYSTTHDTVLKWKNDTVLKVTNSLLLKHDTIVKYVSKVIHDTVRSDDVDVAITDSLLPDSAIEQKVAVNNLRVQNLTVPNKLKIFAGFDIGLALDLKTAVIEPKITVLTKTDACYSIGFDFVNKMPVAGMAWKLHL